MDCFPLFPKCVYSGPWWLYERPACLWVNKPSSLINNTYTYLNLLRDIT